MIEITKLLFGQNRRILSKLLGLNRRAEYSPGKLSQVL